MNILVLDHSVISYKSFWRMFAEEYEGETDDETYEFTRSYCGLIQFYVELFNADAVLWLLDCPREDVWRHEIVQEYYLPRTKIWANANDTTLAELGSPNNATVFMGMTDETIYRKVWTGPDGELHGKQMYKKDFAVVEQEWDLEKRLITDPDVFAKVAAKVIPQYKGTREGSHWPKAAVLNKTEFQRVSLQLAKAVSPHFNGKIAHGANLEADDLALAATMKFGPKHNLIFVTTDKDWNQLALMAPNVTIFDPNKFAIEDTSRDVVLAGMYEKLLTGDESDNIKSVPKLGQTAGIGSKTAKAIIEEVGVSNMKKWCKENCQPEPLDRNTRLINLKAAPIEILARAEAAVNNAYKPPMDKPLTFFVSPATLELAKADAQREKLKWQMQNKGQ